MQKSRVLSCDMQMHSLLPVFSSPIGRVAFFGRYILGIVPLGVGGAILSIAMESQGPFVKLLLLLLALVLEVLGLVYIIGFTIFPRLASIGLSKWFTLLVFVPLVNVFFALFLLFCPAGQFIKHEKVAW